MSPRRTLYSHGKKSAEKHLDQPYPLTEGFRSLFHAEAD